MTAPTGLSQLHSHTYFLTHTTFILCGVQNSLNFVQVRNEHSYSQLHIYKQGRPGKIQTPVHWNLTAPPCVITQQYHSTTFILLHYHSHIKKLVLKTLQVRNCVTWNCTCLEVSVHTYSLPWVYTCFKWSLQNHKISVSLCIILQFIYLHYCPLAVQYCHWHLFCLLHRHHCHHQQ